MSDRFVKHSDVQLLLQQLGLPLIDPASTSSSGSSTVVIDEEGGDEHGPHGAALVPVAGAGSDGDSIVDLDVDDAEPDARRDHNTSLHGPNVASAASVDPGTQLVAASSENQIVPAHVGNFSRVSIKTLCKLSEDDYRKMTPARTIVVAAQASKALAKTSERVTILQRQKRQLSRQLVAQTKQADKKLKAAAQPQSTLELVMTSSGKRLTASAMLALGIRRNLSHVAAGDFGALLLRDISSSTVLRAEVKAGASVAASMSDYANTALAALRTSPESGTSAIDLSDLSFQQESWHLLIISVRADATNSSIWRREKLHVTEAEMGLVSRSVQGFPSDTDKFLETRRCL